MRAKKSSSQIHISIEQVRLSVAQPDTLLFFGLSTDEEQQHGIRVLLTAADGTVRTIPVELTFRTNADIRRRFATLQVPATQQLVGTAALPADWPSASEIRIEEEGAGLIRVLRRDAIKGMEKALSEKLQMQDASVRQGGFCVMDYNIDAVHPSDTGLVLTGWTAGIAPTHIAVTNAAGERIDTQTTRSLRSDVAILYPELPEEEKYGFSVELTATESNAQTPWTVTFATAADTVARTAATPKMPDHTAEPFVAEPATQNAVAGTLATATIDAHRLAQLLPHEATAVEETTSLLQKTRHALQTEGIGGTLKKIARKVWKTIRREKPYTYEQWIAAHDVTEEELERQRQTPLPKQPKLSVVVPVYRPRPEHLQALIDSLRAQTYANWELCLADASGAQSTQSPATEADASDASGAPSTQTPATEAPESGASGAPSTQPPVTETDASDVSGASGTQPAQNPDSNAATSPLSDLLAAAHAADPRIRYTFLASNGGISENTNAAIGMANGDIIVFADHDDVLAPHALYEIAAAWNADERREAIYSDEDKVDIEGGLRFGPHFKSDYNPDLLRSVNYICHIFAVTRGLLDRIGPLRSAYDGAQDYDFVLRACEQAAQVYHIPKILYHWRAHPDSTAENPQSKLYAFEAGKRAIQDHYDRVGLPAHVTDMEFYGTYRSVYTWEEQPLLSILIPNKDHIDDLSRCITSLQEKSTYRNFEIIVIENNSTDPATFDYYERLESGQYQMETANAAAGNAPATANATANANAAAGNTPAPVPMRVVRYEGAFNFSAVNNFGARSAQGDYLLLLNNDTELIRPDSLWEMLSVCMRDDVGAVGARLYYPDNTIQHAGVILGVGPYGGFAGHCFVNMSRYDVGYMNRLICMCDYSAVTGACLLTKKNLYDEVGGLSEDFVVALNDIDYCLKLGALGKHIVYQPYAELYHYESRSRGYDEGSKEKEERLIAEVHRFQEKWSTLLQAGDPYYNPNLTRKGLDWGLEQGTVPRSAF